MRLFLAGLMKRLIPSMAACALEMEANGFKNSTLATAPRLAKAKWFDCTRRQACRWLPTRS